MDEAVARYRQAIANDEHFGLAYYNLGLAYWVSRVATPTELMTNLTIMVDRELKEEEKTDRFYRCEMQHGTLERTVMFPIDVDIEKSKAHLKDGLLEIVLPKAKKAKRHVLKVA